MRVLLIQMPFFALDTPSISLALVKAALEEAGVPCDLRYLNIELGKTLGEDIYSWVGGSAPPYLLVGDLVFTPSLSGIPIDRSRIEELAAAARGPGELSIPPQMIDLFPELVERAQELIANSLQTVEWSRYGLIGFGTMFHIVPALSMAKHIKSLDTAPPVILGGSNCEGEMGEQLHRSFPFIDYLCRGEGERLIVSLARHLTGGHGPPEHVPGLIWRDGAKTRCNGATADGPAVGHSSAEYPLDSLPIPTYDDWMGQMDRLGLIELERRRLPIETSRGCWYGAKHHCVFCGLNSETIAYRRKSPERALTEFRRLQGQGVRMIHSVDDILDMRYFQSVLPELAKQDSNAAIFFEVKSNLTRKHVELLRRAGVVWIQPGIESLNSRLLKQMDKGVSALQNVRLLKYTAEFGISVAWNLLFGFPGEDPRDYQEMADLMPALSHLQPPYVSCSPVRLHRFSPLFVKHEAFGITGVEPAQAYYEFYPFGRETVSRLAYYFDHRYRDERDPMTYIGPCVEAVRNWRAEVGEAAFLCFELGGALHLLDTRKVAAQQAAKLKGLEREVFLACADGATLTQIENLLERPAEEIKVVLADFIARRWAVQLDGQYLNLAVPVSVPPYLPPSLAAMGARQRFFQEMLRSHEGFMVPQVPQPARREESPYAP